MQDRKQLNKEHNRRVKKFVSMIEKIYEVSNQEAIKMAESINYDTSKMFKFADYPELKTKINKFVKEFQKQIKATIVNGITAEWGESNINNDKLVRLILGNNLKMNNAYYNNHEKALQAFIDRKTKGMDLSDRVWRLSKQYKENLEQALSVGLSDGKSAADLSRDIREYLNEPKKLFRRVRDLEGKLQLSKNAKEYNPGNGVYRSSYKNALRLTRTEINMAYRKADSLRWKDLDFVIGIEIKLSDNHTLINPKTGKAEPFYDICDELQGKYPKTFVFTGWHPNCRCFVIPILKSQKELFDKNSSSKNEIKDTPDSFKKWIKKNEERIFKSKSVPYFISENTKEVPELYIALSKKHESSFTTRIQKLVQGLDVHVTSTNLKSDNRIIQKAHNDYEDNIYDVKDIVRTTIVAEQSQIDTILKKVNEEFNIYRHKEQFFEESGYSGHIFNIKTSNGTFAEIQVNTPQMIYGKEIEAKLILGEELFNTIKSKSGLEHGLGHSWYEKVRTLYKDSDKELIDELNKLQRDYYNALKRINI